MLTVNERLEQLHDAGFDASYPMGRDDCGRFSKAIRVKCSRCEAMCINGVPCHESGCRHIRHDDEDIDY